MNQNNQTMPEGSQPGSGGHTEEDNTDAIVTSG